MTGPTQDEVLKKVEDHIMLLRYLYVPGDAFETYENMVTQISYLADKLEFLKHRN